MWAIYKTIFDGYDEEGNEVYRVIGTEELFTDLIKAREKYHKLKDHVENGEYVSYALYEIGEYEDE